MSLPNLPYGDQYRREVRTEWGGLNLNKNAQDGELVDAVNVSTREYPLIATRRGAKTLATGIANPIQKLWTWERDSNPNGYGVMALAVMRTAADPVTYGLFRTNSVLATSEMQFSQITGAVTGGEKTQFATFDRNILIFPDKKAWRYSPMATGLTDLEASVTAWARFTNGQIYGAPAAANTMIVQGDYHNTFKVGDAVTITGIEVNDATHPVIEANNKTAVIRELVVDQYRVSGDTMADCTWLRFDENCWTLNEGDEYDCELTADLPAGTYHYTVDGQNFQFTTTETLAEGGKLFFKSANLRWVKYMKNNVTTAVGISEEGDDGLQLTFINAGAPYTGRVTIARTLPDMDFICVHENRLWGCKGDTIYASKLGDPTNFNVFDGLDTDSWAISTEAGGEFTGCVVYQEHPLFFKPDCVYRVSGDVPGNFILERLDIPGTLANDSICVVRNTLYYATTREIVAYNGAGHPTPISAALSIDRVFRTFSDAGKVCAGTDGDRYFWSYNDATRVYAYDTRFGTWHKETHAGTKFAGKERNLLRYGATVVEQLYNSAANGTKLESGAYWNVTFADSTRAYKTVLSGSESKKNVLRILIRCELEKSMTVSIRYDGGSWEEAAVVGDDTHGAGKYSYNVPLILHRCDYWQMSLDGTGDAVIYSIAVERYGGEMHQAGRSIKPVEE